MKTKEEDVETSNFLKVSRFLRLLKNTMDKV
jgi:hypothetical protein